MLVHLEAGVLFIMVVVDGLRSSEIMKTSSLLVVEEQEATTKSVVRLHLIAVVRSS